MKAVRKLSGVGKSKDKDDKKKDKDVRRSVRDRLCV
jgi:hypothetical protein